MNQERKNELFDRLIDYVCEHCPTEEDKYIAFNDILGFTKEEINEVGVTIENDCEEERD